ncbi:FAD/NAD(P)-binding protein [Herbiconiux sp. CPCC 203407]|uniref:FAD/NAD(P)-binding protein n=1 Tax=Herbiconiux oxytropis TaxID=2970915 RepID=A0AA41XK05_9MICO|nr:FAD/NAD(P)-binding protein [Herbiconiux oxytropis]MCS5723639.1 FAD/NAD(P)-binding protein [Herbiconiux oxytropis]MCS5726956.1 FAD/NAD(P)-binding protein [Herbiconiux oxytropis]
MAASSPTPVSVAIVGAGPRGVGVLERIAANLGELWSPGAKLVVHLIDPYPAGPGRIWRYDQSPLLKLNSMAADVTMFTDETSTIDGPVLTGPSLIDWAEGVRLGTILLRGDRLDVALRAEIDGLTPATFPTRRLQSLYLTWFHERALEQVGDGAEVREHLARVRRVTDAPGGGQRLELDSGATLEADLVLYSLGHTGADPEPEHSRLADFAARRELYYLPPAFTADADTRPIVPGQRVLVRGFGLAAVDLIVLLTEGRGGRFVADGDRVRYVPSGQEPRIIIGSRRGVPYHSKIGSTLKGEKPEPRFFTPAVANRLEAERESLDFASDVWPLIAQEMLWGYYRELFTGHPDRVAIGWAEFAAQFQELDPRASVLADAAGPDAAGPDAAGPAGSGGSGGSGGPRSRGSRGHALPDLGEGDERDRVLADATRLTALIESSVLEEIDRLFLPSFDRPLGGASFADLDEVQHAVRDYVERDLALRTRPEHSATLGLFFALLTSLFAFTEIVASPKWTARSRVDDLNGWWLGYFSFIASGPPAHRLEELLALSEAGVVQFVGGEMWVETDEEGGVFRAGGASHPETVTATALIDARLPGTSVARTDNEVLRLLLESGTALEEVARDADYAVPTGLLSVRPEDRRVLHSSGEPTDRAYAIGPYTNSPFVGAFSRPRTNALSFRENDRVARALLEHAVAIAQDRADASLPRPGMFSDRLWFEFVAEPL